MFDLKKVAYSIRGSYLLWAADENGLILKTMRGGRCRPIFRIALAQGAEVSFVPWELTARTQKGVFRASLYKSEGVFLRGDMPVTVEYCEPQGVYNSNYALCEQGGVRIGDNVNNGFTRITPVRGKVRLSAKSNAGTPESRYLHKCECIAVSLCPQEGEREFVALLEQFHGARFAPSAVDADYEANACAVKRGYEAFIAPYTEKGADMEESAYILWSNIAPAGGNFADEAMVMSKAGMARVWSWDNCFNALALAGAHFSLSLGQFMLPYRFIDAAGRVPDDVSDSFIEWTHVKPPVQGWTYRRMMRKDPAFAAADVLSEVYFPVKRNTDWWLNFQGEIPAYLHGNDSGCDNATCFDGGGHLETPELCAFLSEQCLFLSEAAEKLGLHYDVRHYARLSEEFARLVSERYFDGQLFCIDADSGKKVYSDALMPLRTVILGNRLPQKVLRAAVDKLRRHLGECGFSSEALDSPLYMRDGYWRGPAWGSDQIMFGYALREIGETELADAAARGYRRAPDKYGYGENSDPHTGEAFRCRNYCWTACARLLL